MGLKSLWRWLFRRWSRGYWEDRANRLPAAGWFVGRTDMYSYVNGNYVHYAYPPNGGQRIPFLGSPVSALRRAVKHAEKMNAATAATQTNVKA